MQPSKTQATQAPAPTRVLLPGTAKKRVRIIKKVRIAGGLWKFISLERVGSRYVWDQRPGYYFLEWWQGKKRRRQLAGQTPSQALEAQRRKRNELVGELLAQGKAPPKIEEGTATQIADAIPVFLEHVKAHSPEKPLTVRRYREVLRHFERLLGKKKYVEAITRADIDDYKIKRSEESNGRQDHPPKPRTINFEVSTLRTFFYYLINERGVPLANPCARFKPLKDEKERAGRKPPTYTPAELHRLFAACDDWEKTAFATLLLTGLREQELCYLTWKDVDLKRATIKVTGEGKEGFSPKDYEERVIPTPPVLVALLKKLPQSPEWVFPSPKGGRMNHLLRRLKGVAEHARVAQATLHKFRHTYATRLLEKGCDIVTVQHLMGHSDLDTTRQYLSPDESLKRKAVARLTLAG
ncbi:MAG TPA: tyrosine-type recombinase/integrase [Candidatus Acidoferrales bacterium]|nr:tyrosine-type recombinase/integrase [Candidatus Acidoferrales bacterium]